MSKAIAFIRANQGIAVTLEQLAAEVQMAPEHFQKTFARWTGVTPKQFSRLISLEQAKDILRRNKSNLLESAWDMGLSSGSRLHDLFVKIERMSPGEYKQGGKGLVLRYGFLDTRFGNLLAAETSRGLCFAQFYESSDQAKKDLMDEYPEAEFKESRSDTMNRLESLLNTGNQPEEMFIVHLKGTDFQLKVWNALMKIPSGSLKTYSDIAVEIGQTKASRAVGSAIGANPLAYLIPCHRVIRGGGDLGGYRWGLDRKSAIIGMELGSVKKEAK